MLSRQKVALRFIQLAGRPIGRIELTKWLFLLSVETPSRGGESFYSFVPYKLGPFSFSLDYELNQLLRDGLVKPFESVAWEATVAGEKYPAILSSQVQRDIDLVFKRYSDY